MITNKLRTAFLSAALIAIMLAAVFSFGPFTAYAFEPEALPAEQSEAPEDAADPEPDDPEEPEPISIEDGKITLKYFSYTYKGVPVTPDDRNGVDEVTVKVGGKKLTKGVDYKLTYSNNKRPGTATITATGLGGYTGKLSRIFAVKPATNTIGELETGNGIKVNYGKDTSADGYQILYSTDRTFATYHSTTVWDTNKTYVCLTNVPKIGEKYYIKMRSFVVVNGKRYGNYSSLRSKTVKGSIAKVTLPSLEYTYVGRALVPSVKAWDKYGNRLTEGTDYNLKITNATNVGTATITVTGKGHYLGTKTRTFKVVAVPIAKTALSNVSTYYNYTGSAVTPEPVLKYKSLTLKKGTDYTVSYSSNNAIGVATMTITGKGNYSGTRTRSFHISKMGWETENGWKVYYSLGKKCTGKTTVGGDTYYFDSDGHMQTGWQKIGDDFYCFDRQNGKMYKSRTIDKIKVDSTGKAVSLTTYGKQRIATMMHAHQILLDNTSPTDSMAEKRRKIFEWEYSSFPYHQWRYAVQYYDISDEWDILFANDIFVRGGGCCVSDSAAVAFLFLEIGYTDINLCISDIGHGYIIMNGRMYDPLYAEWQGWSYYDRAPGIWYTVHSIRID